MMFKRLLSSLLLLPVGICSGEAVEKTTENLIRDSSFEETQEYRPDYHQIGEYRLDCAPQGISFTGKEYFHGKRSLEIAPGAEWRFETTDRYAENGVFSASLKGGVNGKADVEISAVTLDLHGGKLNPASTAGNFSPTGEWQRITLPFINKRKEFGAIYMITVRNTGASPLWLDAVQLELEKTQPSTYTSERYSRRDIDQIKSYKLNSHNDAANPAGRQDKTGEVKLTLLAPADAARCLQPVRGGVPFPPGELFDASRASLTDAAGQTIPCQTTVLARRNTDGSIVSLLLDFQAQLNTGEKRQYILRYGGAQVPAGKPLAELQGDRIVIATGTVTAVLNTRQFRMFDEIRGADGRIVSTGVDAGAFVITSNGKEFSSSTVVPTICRIENNGSQRAVIRVAGKHRAANDQRLLDYEIRIHAFKNQSYFLIEYTLMNQDTLPDLSIRTAGLRLPVVAGNDKRSFGLINAPALEIPASAGRTALTQLRQRNGECSYDLLLSLPDGSEKRLKNTKADGVASIGEASVAVADFWQLNPKELAAEPGRLSVYQWPADGVKDLALPFGIASTIRLIYAPLGGGKNVIPPADAPLLLQPDPAWMSASKVFGSFITAEQSRREFPRFAAIEDRIFDLTKRFQDVTDFNGMFDYGDFGAPAYCSNHETEGVDNLWLNYLRTGDPEMYQLAVDSTRHSRDIDVCHIRPGVAARHSHSTGTHTSYHFHTGHFWQTGLLWHYLLTGDQRSFDTAIDSAAELMSKSGIKYTPGRERARIIFHLAELYGLTGIVQFRQGFERQYNYGAGSVIGHSYYGGISLGCLEKMYEVTGDKKYAEALEADTKKIRALTETDRTGKAEIGIGEGRDWHFFKVMGEAAERTNDPGYLVAANEYFLTPFSIAMTPADYCFSTSTPYFHALARFGVKEPSDLPENLFGINRLTGIAPAAKEPNVFHFVIPGDQPFILRIYKQLKFRYKTMFKYDKDRMPSVNYCLVSPDGKIVEQGKLDGDQDEFAIKNIEVKSSVKGDYRLELAFYNDCWGALSCSVPARLDANRWFSSRVSRYYPVAFWLRAPASGPLTVNFRWPYDGNGYAGQILGAALEDENGRVVSRSIWTVPMNWRNDNNGKYCTQKLTLAIPAELRGKPLRLLVNDVKWLEWQIGGLDYPWLSEVKAGVRQ